MIWSGMVGYGAALDANLVNWNKELAAAGVVAFIKLMHTPQPWLQSTHITDSAFLAFRSWMVLGGVKKMHVCLAGRGRGRESSSEKYTRPRRSSGCQKRSQKSAKATTGLKGRPQLFRFGQLGGPGVRSQVDLVFEGQALCKNWCTVTIVARLLVILLGLYENQRDLENVTHIKH